MERSFWQKYSLVLVLSMLAVVMVIIKISYRPSEEDLKPKQEIIPTSTPMPTVIPTPTLITDADYPLWDKLPYQGEGFIVDRYTKKLTLAVKAKGLDKKIAETRIKEWIMENGYTAESHKLVWEN